MDIQAEGEFNWGRGVVVSRKAWTTSRTQQGPLSGRPSKRWSKVRDFAGIEIQTVDTTGTVWPERQRLLKEFGVPRADEEELSTKSYGMN